MPNVQRCQKTSKIGKPTGLGLRLTSANILPRALSTDKLCQVTNLVRKKTNQALQNRFAFKSPLLSLKRPNSETMIVDEVANESTADNGAASNLTTDTIKVLSRTETFTIDRKNEAVVGAECNTNNLTHQIKSPQEIVKTKRKLSFGYTKMDGNIFDTFECLMDTPAPSDQSYTIAMRNVGAAAVRPDTLMYATRIMNDTGNVSSISNFNDITMVGDDDDGGISAERVLCSTMMCTERLVDITSSDSPIFPSMDVMKNKESSANMTNLLYMTRDGKDHDDQNETVKAVQDREEDDRMEIDERPYSGEFTGNK